MDGHYAPMRMASAAWFRSSAWIRALRALRVRALRLIGELREERAVLLPHGIRGQGLASAIPIYDTLLRLQQVFIFDLFSYFMPRDWVCRSYGCG